MSTAMVKAGEKSSGLATQQQKIQTIRQLLEKQRSQIKIALPKGWNEERFNRVVMTAIQANPQLAECEPMSMVRSVMEAAQLGLEIGGVLGHGYLIPRWNGKKQCNEVQFQPGYKGLIELAMRSGKVSVVYARTVYEKDQFFHKDTLEREILEYEAYRGADRGKAWAWYAVARMKDGGAKCVVRYRDQIDAHRARGANKGRSPWDSDYDAMGEKTVLKILCKTLPVSVEDARAINHAIAVDDALEEGRDPPVMDDALDAIAEPADTPPAESKLDALASALPAEPA